MSAERITMYAERMRKERDEAQLASLETNERDTKIILELRAENARLRAALEWYKADDARLFEQGLVERVMDRPATAALP